MGCSTFILRSPEDLEKTRDRLLHAGIEHRSFVPSPAEPTIRLWAVSVSEDDANRTREILFTGDNAVVGYYNLPGAERPLPQESNFRDGVGTVPFEKIWIDSIEQCFADETKIRLMAHLDGDIGSLLPYLNSVIKAAQYDPELPMLSFRQGIRMITVYRDRIGIVKADNLFDAWQCMKEIKEKIQYVHERKDDIKPDFEMFTLPAALDIYKLLPKTNCGLCGRAACMAFAALLSSGEADHDDCPVLLEERQSEMRSQLLELLGESD